MQVIKSMTVESVAQRWKDQYYDDWHGNWSKIKMFDGKDPFSIYEQLKTAKTLKECDEIIGNTSWTTLSCNECMDSSNEPMIRFDINCGEYSHTVCADCLNQAIGMLLNQGEN